MAGESYFSDRRTSMSQLHLRWIRSVAVALVTCWAGAAMAAEQSDWKRFTSKEGGFSILMPGIPNETTKTLPQRQGLAFDARSGLFRDKVYATYHRPLNLRLFPRGQDINSIADLVQRGMERRGFKVIEQRTIAIGIYSGRDYRLESPDSRTEIRSRDYLVGSRLVSVMVSGRRGTLTDEDTRIFFDSLRVAAVGRDLRDKGTSLLRQAKYEAAIARFNAAIEHDPNDDLVYNERGVAYTWLDKDAEAIRDFTRALELNDEAFMTYRNRGAAYLRQGKLEPALTDFNKAITLNDRYARAYQGRGDVYKKLGKLKEAEADYNMARQLEVAKK
jgi:tetratricopeptide (TPR) repeat protein